MAVNSRLLALLFAGLVCALALGHQRLRPAPPVYRMPSPFLADEQRPATQSEELYGRIASTIARRPVGVRCRDLEPGVKGEVVFPDGRHPENFAMLTPDVCLELYDFRQGLRAWAVVCLEQRGNGCGADAYWTVFALTALAHESIHLRGVRNESLTQCLAIGELHVVAEALGSDPDQAAALQRFAIEHEYAMMPSDYRSLDCSKVPSGTGEPGL